MTDVSGELPATWNFGYPIFHAETRSAWRNWLALHHGDTPGVWLCSWRTPASGTRCPYPDSVEEAICFGWIDSTINTFDESRNLQLFTPRKAKSTWTRLNRRRFAAMESAGLMTAAGLRSREVAQGNGWWTIYDPVEDLIEPAVLADALDAKPAARAAWDGFPPSARKFMLWWVISGAKSETQQRRVAEIVAKAAVGIRAKP